MADISDGHLLNIIAMLDRKALSVLNEGYRFMSGLQGEMAIDAAESQIDNDVGRIEARRRVFEDEARRRGLRVPTFEG